MKTESVMRKQSSLKINVALNIIKTLMGVLFPLITFSYVSRVLGPEGTGKVSYSISIISYFSIIAGLGIGTYGMREASKIRNNEFELNKFCREIFFINIISTCVAYGLLAVVLIFFKSLIEYRALLFICSSTIFFTTIGMEWLYSAMEDYLYITIRSIAFQIFGIVLLFLMVRDSQDYLQYAFLSVITSVGSNFLNFIHSKKYINLLRKTPLEIKKHLKPIFILFGTVVAVSLYTVLDTTMIGYFCGDGEVGIYNAATKSTRIVIMVIAATGTVLAPRLSNYVENDKENYKTLLVKSFNVYVGFAVPCAVGLYFLARPITLLLCGIKYEASISVMKMLAPIVLFVPLGAFFSDQIFTPMRKDKFSLIPVLITAVCNIILNLILIPKYGALGAAFASVIAEIIVVIIKLILSSGLVKISLLFSNFYQYVIASMMMFLGLFGLSFVLDMEKTISIVLYPLVGAIIYFIVLLLFKNSFVIEVVLSIKNKIGEKICRK